MPSLGLLLECPIFESYNTRVKNMNGKLDPSHPDVRHPINFDSLKDRIEEFKDEQIYKRMRTSEEKSLVYVSFLYPLSANRINHPTNLFLFLPIFIIWCHSQFR